MNSGLVGRVASPRRVARWPLPLYLALSLLAALLIGSIIGAVIVKARVPATHASSRTKAILSQAAQKNFPVIVLGDSIVELAVLPDLCGQETLNAGIGGATIAQVDELARILLRQAKPGLVVIAAGLNNAHVDDADDEADFAQSYRDVIRLAQARGARVVALNIGPVGDNSFANARLFDPQKIRHLNATIANLGVPTLDLWREMSVSNRPILRAGFTIDGVHPSALGYRSWDAVLLQACAAIGSRPAAGKARVVGRRWSAAGRRKASVIHI